MPDNRSTDYEGAAQATVDLVDHTHTPDRVSDAVLETLIEMSAESRIDIWRRERGLSVESLAALYRRYETGAGSRRALDSMAIMKSEEKSMNAIRAIITRLASSLMRRTWERGHLARSFLLGSSLFSQFRTRAAGRMPRAPRPLSKLTVSSARRLH